ncbi:MAG: DUF3786 domain-containing protein [Desulfosalsimonas sp.]|uniref:DUF3786 domain-containing protein n=1 Tax=Desulfosalsimonas sp. TaxID=3073848 RepID=UPI003970FACA
MAQINSPMDVFKLTDGSNCRACNEKTCMAFGVAVFKGRKTLDQCPKIAPEVLAQYQDATDRPDTIDEFMEQAVEELQGQIPDIDLADAARRTGGEFDGQKLTLRVMGKAFSVDTAGNLSADIHLNAWVAMPFLNHVLHGKGVAVIGEWITFRELEGGPERYNHFQQNCEKPLKHLADTYTDLFSDMLDVFSGRRVQTHIDSDISVVLHPLPLLPVMCCYWEPEEGMGSSLHLFFDKSADQQIDAESIYTLLAGMVKMFEKIAARNQSSPS